MYYACNAMQLRLLHGCRHTTSKWIHWRFIQRIVLHTCMCQQHLNRSVSIIKVIHIENNFAFTTNADYSTLRNEQFLGKAVSSRVIHTVNVYKLVHMHYSGGQLFHHLSHYISSVYLGCFWKQERHTQPCHWQLQQWRILFYQCNECA